MKKLSAIAVLAVLGTAFSFPMLAHAESNYVTGTGSLSATAHLDFRIKIPKVLYLRVGTGTTLANNTTVDLIDFDVTAANLSAGTSVAGTGGDLGGGAVTVRLFANGGSSATLTASTTGLLTNATSDTIPWTEIVATAGSLAATTSGYSNGSIAHPAFNATGTGTGAATTIAGTGNLVRAEGKWTFAYANSAPVPAGTYGGTTALNGRVTYTATQP